MIRDRGYRTHAFGFADDGLPRHPELVSRDLANRGIWLDSSSGDPTGARAFQALLASGFALRERSKYFALLQLGLLRVRLFVDAAVPGPDTTSATTTTPAAEPVGSHA